MRKIDLSPMLRPASIAVIGASANPAKVGSMPLRLLREHGYRGRLYAINTRSRDVQDLRALPSLDAVSHPVDLAILAVPAHAVPGVFAQMAKNRTRAALVLSSGFAETGAAGRALQQEMARRADAAGITLLGPNSLGLINLRERIYATFSPVALAGTPPLGNVALVSQSGAFGAYAFALAREAGLGLSHWITTGNEAGVQVADAIAWLAHDLQTTVILVYLEGCPDGANMRRALAAARAAGKPVVVTKVGTSATGARAIQSHTASLAGEDAVYQAVFDEYGVHRAYTLDAFFRLGYALSAGRRPLSRALAIVTVSGGIGVMMADRAEALGLSLPPLPAPYSQRILARIEFASTTNPIDVTGQVVAQPGVFADALADAAECGLYGSVITFVGAGGSVPSAWVAIQRAVERIEAAGSRVPLVFAGLIDGVKRAWLEAHGALVFREPVHAVEAVAALLRAEQSTRFRFLDEYDAERGDGRSAWHGDGQDDERRTGRSAGQGDERNAERGAGQGDGRNAERSAGQGGGRNAERSAGHGDEHNAERSARQGDGRGTEHGVEHDAERSAERSARSDDERSTKHSARHNVRYARATATMASVAPLTLPASVPLDALALDEAEAMRVLADAGIATAPLRVASTAREAVQAARQLGFPVVLKLRSRHVLHKSGVGGVHLNLHDDKAVERAFGAIEKAAARAALPDGFEGVVVARMLAGRGEIIVGLRRDPVFGPVVMVGPGGIDVERGRRMVFGLTPLAHGHARALLEDCGVARFFSGHRGRPVLSLDDAAAVLVAVSRIGEGLGNALDTLEVNPFILTRQGLVAADAVITLTARQRNVRRGADNVGSVHGANDGTADEATNKAANEVADEAARDAAHDADNADIRPGIGGRSAVDGEA